MSALKFVFVNVLRYVHVQVKRVAFELLSKHVSSPLAGQS